MTKNLRHYPFEIELPNLPVKVIRKWNPAGTNTFKYFNTILIQPCNFIKLFKFEKKKKIIEITLPVIISTFYVGR